MTEAHKLRQKAHDLAAKIWGEWNDPDSDKSSMYKWLKAHSFSGHMGDMSISELRYVIGKLKILKSQANGKLKRISNRNGSGN